MMEARSTKLQLIAQAVKGTGGTIPLPVIQAGLGAALLVIHEVTGGTVGGHVKLNLVTDLAGDNAVPHHGAGVNIPGANTTSSYSCVAYAVSEYVQLQLVTGDTTAIHNVWVQVMNV